MLDTFGGPHTLTSVRVRGRYVDTVRADGWQDRFGAEDRIMAGTGVVVLTPGQRCAAGDMARRDLAAAVTCVQSARGWRLMPEDLAARRYVDQRAEARRSLAAAGDMRRRACYYASLARSGMAAAGTGWDPAVWGDPVTV